MADDKKKDAKAAPASNPNHGLIFFLLGIFLLALIIGQVSMYLNNIGWGNFTNVWNYFLHSYFFPLWSNWKFIAVFISVVMLVLTVYSQFKLRQLEAEEEKIYGPTPESQGDEESQTEKEKNKKWETVLAHAASNNPADWRLAIMEADIMLEEALRAKGFPGDSIGEMLKSAKPGDMVTLDAAWDAHKVRNKIAHSGSEFELNEREKERVISLFEAVFKELGEV